MSDQSGNPNTAVQIPMSGGHDVVSTTVTHELSPVSKSEMPLLIGCIIILTIALKRSGPSSLVWLLSGILLIATRMAAGIIIVHLRPESDIGWQAARLFSVLGIAGWISITWYCWKILGAGWSNKS